MTALRPEPSRVEVLERRWLRVVHLHGRAVDRAVKFAPDGDPVSIPIPESLCDDVWDSLPDPPASQVRRLAEGWNGIRVHKTRHELAAEGLPCPACGIAEWYVGPPRDNRRGRVVYCRPCRRKSTHVEDVPMAGPDTCRRCGGIAWRWKRTGGGRTCRICERAGEKRRRDAKRKATP